MQAQGSQGLGTTQRVLLLPTVIINTNQYRGRLDGGSLTRALCAGFAEATEPELCLSGSLQASPVTRPWAVKAPWDGQRA